MQTNKYKAFIEVVGHQSITKAAKKLNYTQSNISQMVQSLEKEFNVSLLTRNNEKIIPTQAAERLLPYMINIIENEQNLYEEANRINNIEIGDIKIGTYISMANSYLPGLLSIFHKQYPGIKITLSEANTTEMTQLMKDRKIDFAMAVGSDFRDIEFFPLFRDKLMVILPLGHPLGEKEKIRPEEVFEYPFISTEVGSETHLVKLYGKSVIAPEVNFRTKTEMSIMTMVACGLGVSVISDLFLKNPHPDLLIRELDSPDNYRELGICYHSKENLSPASKKFIKIATENLGQMM